MDAFETGKINIYKIGTQCFDEMKNLSIQNSTLFANDKTKFQIKRNI